jgi:hypothetical protein
MSILWPCRSDSRRCKENRKVPDSWLIARNYARLRGCSLGPYMLFKTSVRDKIPWVGSIPMHSRHHSSYYRLRACTQVNTQNFCQAPLRVLKVRLCFSPSGLSVSWTLKMGKPAVCPTIDDKNIPFDADTSRLTAFTLRHRMLVKSARRS